ncbi:Short-chain dehydrogenase [Phytophthora megakarya]|uniref:Short-chain dehydrogenase n=1 Tax=Phytophthora megakarya TaxID=4795 RepID=A0A225WAG9_9STRA|nr:Short-chain dehydrogenase [Phytophthora megakarya]
MEGCYLTALPSDAMQSLAGFSPDRHSFFLERAALPPPQSLQYQVFPFVETYMEAYGQASAPHMPCCCAMSIRIIYCGDTLSLVQVCSMILQQT